MGNLSIFLAVVAVASIILSASAMKDPSIAVKQPWMVTIHRKISSANPKSSEFLCTGAVVAANIIYFVGVCVKDLQPSELKVFMGSSDSDSDTNSESYDVKQIIYQPIYGDKRHALLVLPGNITNAQPVSLPQEKDTSDPKQCVTSQPQSLISDSSKREEKNRSRGEFSHADMRGNEDNKIFIEPKDRSNYPYRSGSGSGSCSNCKYSSPLVCLSRHDSTRWFLIGKVVWDGKSDYQFNTDAKGVSRWVNREIKKIQETA